MSNFSSSNLIVRTASIIKEPYDVEFTNSKGEKTKYRQVIVRVACTRQGVGKQKQVKNGQEVMDYPTDWFAVRLSGQNAEYFEKYGMYKDDSGKLISRRLYLQGNFETYQKDREVVIDGLTINFSNGQALTITKEMGVKYVLRNETNYIFAANFISFLDKSPVDSNNGQQNVIVNTPQNINADIDLSGVQVAGAVVQGVAQAQNNVQETPVPQVSSDFDGMNDPW